MGVQVNQKDGNRRNNNRGQQGGRMDSQGSHENRVSYQAVCAQFLQKNTNLISNFNNLFFRFEEPTT